MIRQVELSLKFLNKEKRIKLTEFHLKYIEALKFFVDILWDSNEYKFVTTDSLKKSATLILPVELNSVLVNKRFL